MKLSAGLFVLALALVGCGGGSTPAPTTPANAAAATQTSTTTTTAANEKIHALSADEIRGLTEGRALRFGQAAEKNQNPAPYFLLKYRTELALFDEQMTPARAIMERERAQAAKLGKELVDDEAKLESMLATPGSREDDVAALTREIARLEGEIRLVHLQADVATKKLINPDQVVQYNAIRGYDPEEDGRDAQTHEGKCATRP